MIIVAPGAVATPIWDKADAVDVTPFANSPYAPSLERMKRAMISMGKAGLPPERIGEAVKTALTAVRPKTRYTVTPNPIQNLVVTTLPKRMVDTMVAKRLGLKA